MPPGPSRCGAAPEKSKAARAPLVSWSTHIRGMQDTPRYAMARVITSSTALQRVARRTAWCGAPRPNPGSHTCAWSAISSRSHEGTDVITSRLLRASQATIAAVCGWALMLGGPCAAEELTIAFPASPDPEIRQAQQLMVESWGESGQQLAMLPPPAPALQLCPPSCRIVVQQSATMQQSCAGLA